MKREKKTIKAKVGSNKAIAAGFFMLEVKAPFLGKHSVPGQFVNVKVNEGATDPLLRIPLGVHRIRKEGIMLLYKVVGKATEMLSCKKKGDTVDLLGPLGKGFDHTGGERENENILVAGGHGVAPLFSLAERLLENKIKVTVIIGARDKKELVCVNELKVIGAKVKTITDNGTCGTKGYVTDLLEKTLKQKLPTTNYELRTKIYACGPLPMIKELSKVCKKYKIPAQVTRDEYMACGIGACRGCAVKTKNGAKLACTDGPVFDAEELVW